MNNEEFLLILPEEKQEELEGRVDSEKITKMLSDLLDALKIEREKFDKIMADLKREYENKETYDDGFSWFFKLDKEG